MFIQPNTSVLKPELVTRARRFHFAYAIHASSYCLLGQRETVGNIAPLRNMQFYIVEHNTHLNVEQSNRILQLCSSVNRKQLIHFSTWEVCSAFMHVPPERVDSAISFLHPACLYQRGTITRREFLEILMKEHDYSAVPKDVYDRLDASIAALESALESKDPQMKNHLRESHSLLVSYPETVNLLRDNEVHTLIVAAQEHTKTEIIKQTASGKAGGAGSRKSISVSDI